MVVVVVLKVEEEEDKERRRQSSLAQSLSEEEEGEIRKKNVIYVESEGIREGKEVSNVGCDICWTHHS